MRVLIPDDLAAEYQSQRPNAALDDIITKTLTRFRSIVLADRVLFILPEDRQAVERALGDVGSVTTAAELITSIERIRRIALGGIEIPFTDAQRRAIQQRAEKERTTPEAVLQYIAKESVGLMLEGV